VIMPCPPTRKPNPATTPIPAAHLWKRSPTPTISPPGRPSAIPPSVPRRRARATALTPPIGPSGKPSTAATTTWSSATRPTIP